MVDSQFTPDIPKLYHYKLQRILGEGGTGRVYLGIDMNKGAPAAIKLFHENFFRNRLHVRDLAKSITKYKRFKHNNVVQIFDFIDGPEGRCLVMEYGTGPAEIVPAEPPVQTRTHQHLPPDLPGHAIPATRAASTTISPPTCVHPHHIVKIVDFSPTAARSSWNSSTVTWANRSRPCSSLSSSARRRSRPRATSIPWASPSTSSRERCPSH